MRAIKDLPSKSHNPYTPVLARWRWVRSTSDVRASNFRRRTHSSEVRYINDPKNHASHPYRLPGLAGFRKICLSTSIAPQPGAPENCTRISAKCTVAAMTHHRPSQRWISTNRSNDTPSKMVKILLRVATTPTNRPLAIAMSPQFFGLLTQHTHTQHNAFRCYVLCRRGVLTVCRQLNSIRPKEC